MARSQQLVQTFPRVGPMLEEFREHLPYTVFAALTALGLLGGLVFLAGLGGRASFLPRASEDLFHAMHFLHLFLSAMATTAVFWRYDRKVVKAVIIGLVGTALPCGASDILFPLMGGRLMGIQVTAHICFVEHPVMVWPFMAAGILAGFILPSRKPASHLAHGGHVFISSTATMLYLVAFGTADWIRLAPFIFVLLVAAVMVPCCTSDIVFPMLMTSPDRPDHCASHRPL
mgnify:CR=1 FL=1